MAITPSELMACGFPAGVAGYIAENAEPGASPTIAVLSISAAGPFPVPTVTPTYSALTDWADASIPDETAFSYADGLLTAQKQMIVIFGAALNFAATDAQLIQARVKIGSSDVEYSACDEGTGDKDSISLFGVGAVAPGDTLSVEMREESGASVIVLQECSFSVCGLI